MFTSEFSGSSKPSSEKEPTPVPESFPPQGERADNDSSMLHAALLKGEHPESHEDVVGAIRRRMSAGQFKEAQVDSDIAIKKLQDEFKKVIKRHENVVASIDALELQFGKQNSDELELQHDVKLHKAFHTELGFLMDSQRDIADEIEDFGKLKKEIVAIEKENEEKKVAAKKAEDDLMDSMGW